MSRSWTPKETLLAEKALNTNWREHRIYFTDAKTGEERPMIPDDEWEYTAQFPILSHCGMDVLHLVYKKYKDKGTDVLMMVEKELEEVIEDDENPLMTAREHGSPQFSTREWYEGRLDPSFYYADHNDEMFFDEISVIIEQKSGNFIELSEFAEDHQEIVDFVKEQVGLNLNKFRSGNGVNAFTTTYWDKLVPRVAFSREGMKEEEWQKVQLLASKNKRFCIEQCGAWLIYAYLSDEKENAN